MSRFVPDTLREALLRPVAMAAPDGNVYVEIMAPDFRFVFILALVLVWAFLALRRQAPRKPTLLLLGFTAIAFVPWLATTGNGRYFIAFLLVAGPLCLALIHQLPYTRAFRATLAVFAVATQLFLIQQNSPWHWWGLTQWADGPFFETEIDDAAATEPATYVTVSSISYSLLIPRFAPSARWVNLTAQRGAGDRSREMQRTRAMLDTAKALKVVFPVVGSRRMPGEPPGDELVEVINDLMAQHRLLIAAPDACRFLVSKGFASSRSRRPDQPPAQGDQGFWVCPLVRAAGPYEQRPPERLYPADDVFDKLERLCPGLFPRGGAWTRALPDGALRSYIGTDMKLYVLSDGQVLYKYLRALNPELVGTTQEVLDTRFRMNCDQVRGRTGLPWERQI